MNSKVRPSVKSARHKHFFICTALSYQIPTASAFLVVSGIDIAAVAEKDLGMNEENSPLTTRRSFIKSTGTLAAASALAGVTLPHVFAAENNTIISY